MLPTMPRRLVRGCASPRWPRWRPASGCRLRWSSRHPPILPLHKAVQCNPLRLFAVAIREPDCHDARRNLTTRPDPEDRRRWRLRCRCSRWWLSKLTLVPHRLSRIGSGRRRHGCSPSRNDANQMPAAAILDQAAHAARRDCRNSSRDALRTDFYRVRPLVRRMRELRRNIAP